MTLRYLIIAIIALSVPAKKTQAQYCDSLTPYFYTDLSANANAFWISPDTARDGNCCGTTNPDNCVEFEILLHPDASGILFDIHSGAVPPGALFYQINCGPPTPVGEVICLNGPGPHHITFCKPGNNTNEYIIQSIGEPEFGPDVFSTDGCSKWMYVSGLEPTSITWESIAPDAPGTYNGLLSCTFGCDSTLASWQNGAPAFVDYLVCGYALGGCDSTLICDTIRAYFNTSLQVNITPQNPTICFGNSGTTVTANPTGGTSPYFFNWSNGATTQSIFAGPGTHIVELSDSTGCPSVFDTVFVGQFNLPIEADAGPDLIVCEDQLPAQVNATFQAASGVYWSSLGSGQFANPTDASTSYMPSQAEINNGTATLIVETTGNGTCPPDYDTVILHISNFDALVSLQSYNISCNGANDGQADVAVSGSTPPYLFSWNGNTPSTNTVIQNLSAGQHTLQITNGDGCDTLITFNITEPSPLTFNSFAFNNPLCFGNADGAINYTVNGGNPTYQFFLNGTQNTNGFNSNLNAGQYDIQVIDQNGCTLDSSLILNEPQQLTTALNYPASVCINNPANIDLTVQGGTQGYNYNWSNGGQQQDQSIIITQDTTLQVVVTDANGCQISDTVQIGVLSLDIGQLQIAGVSELCAGDSVVLSADIQGYVHPPYSIVWSHCNSCYGNGPFLDWPNSSTQYIVTLSDGCGNTIHDTLDITLNPLPVFTLPDTLAQGCLDLEVDFMPNYSGSVASAMWEISNGETHTGINLNTTIYAPGNYNASLSVTDANGCSYSQSNGLIVALPTPYAYFSANRYETDIHDPMIHFSNSSIVGSGYQWDFGDGNSSILFEPSHSYENEGTYTVELVVSNVHGCTDTAWREIIINPVSVVFIPNAFTPDGDGINDEFLVFGDNLVAEDFEMMIFDRWGQLVFSSQSQNVGWDGTDRGQPAKSDVYVYKVIAKDVLGQKQEFLGHVSLLK